ncbi:hypothetical protein [Hydrogeniiclostridium mannosilyticum]|uniref:hypothetical protein n=1 Tax=Hydrogeniiclostridium mannosilyticum TaxID=2764322 RepID=UPI00399B3CB6
MSFGLEKPTCLKQMGFSEEEIAYYERLIGAGECSERDRILMISEKRRIILNTIHELEAQIMQLDCLRSEIRQKIRFA